MPSAVANRRPRHRPPVVTYADTQPKLSARLPTQYQPGSTIRDRLALLEVDPEKTTEPSQDPENKTSDNSSRAAGTHQ